MNLARPTVISVGCVLLAVGTGALACSSKSSSSVDSAKRREAAAPAAPAADSILQARLQQAVRDLAKADVRRGPDPFFADSRQGFGSIGEGGSATRHTRAAPHVWQGATSVSGRLPPEVIQRIVRQNFGRFRLCYENALRTDPNLIGRISVAFTIGRDGSVNDAKETTDLADKAFASCVKRGFSGLSFPQPEGGIVRVTYPLQFSPGDTPPPASSVSGEPAPSAAPPALPSAPLAPVLTPPPLDPWAAPANPADANGPWPIVAVDRNIFQLDGALVGSSKAVIETGRLQKVDELFSSLKTRREEWKARHSNSPFPGGSRAP